MLKRMVIVLVLIGLVLGGVFGFEAFRSVMTARFMATLANPTQTVSTTIAASQDWQSQLEAVGSLRAVNGASLSGNVSGIVSTINFESGTDVRQGDLLLQLESAEDIAHLEALKATAELTKITFDRDSALGKNGTVSKEVVDTDNANMLNAQALVAQQQALVDYKTIKAPFSGRLGLRQVDIGQYLAAGTTIVALQQLDPILVDFHMPQQALAQVRVGQPMTAKVDTFPDLSFTGKVTAIDSQVDPATRNVQVQATVSNKDLILLPGMFVTVDIDVAAPEKFVTLPQTAVAFNSYGNIVYLVEDKGKDANGKPQLVAQQTFVSTGQTRGDQIAIISGVKDGDVVVSAGQIKLRNGTPVAIDNTVQPSNDPNPKPVDE